MGRVELSQARRDFLAALAEDVFQAYSINGSLALDEIAEDRDVGLTYDDFGQDFDGLIEHRSGNFHIFVNTTRNPAGSARARFTLGHEYGHYFIDEHRNALAAGQQPHPSFTDRPAENPAEHEANFFSSHLLMPVKAFSTALKKTQRGVQGICTLANDFNVSVQSAAIRYVAGCGRPCAIIMFREAASPWWEVSAEMESLGLIWIRRFPNLWPAECASALAQKDDPNKKNKQHETGTLANVWFTGIGAGSANNLVLKETAIRLGKWGVLTLLEQ